MVMIVFLSIGIATASPLWATGSSIQRKSTAKCDPKALERARGAVKVDNLKQAKGFLNDLRDCEGKLGVDANTILQEIQRKETIIDLWSRYLIDIHNQDYDSACQKLLKIEGLDPDYPGLERARAKAGGCDEELRRLKLDLDEAERLFTAGSLRQALVLAEKVVKARPDFEDARRIRDSIKQVVVEATRRDLENDYERAQKSIRDGDWTKAKKTLTAIAQRDSGYKDVQGLLRQCDDALGAKAEPDRPPEQPILAPASDQAFQSALQTAQSRLDKGFYEEALEAARRAADLAPRDFDPSPLLAKIRNAQATEKGELQAILEAFFSGSYDSSAELARSLRRHPRQPLTTAFALFFEASSQLSLKVLKTGFNESDVESARAMIEQAKRLNGGVTFWWKYVSPKLRSLIEQTDAAATDPGANPAQIQR